MPFQTGLPAALKARGLVVELVPGWETRGSSAFTPKGAVCHWTAGPANSKTRPSLNICTNGRSDLPGPLCNVYLDRNGVAVVVAAGRANHAGAGNWKGLTGNSQLFGTECEAAGANDFTAAQRAAYPKVNAAFADLGGFGADMVCGHSEFALPKGRKVDINGYTMDAMRAQVAALLTNPNLVEDDMPLTDADIQKIWAFAPKAGQATVADRIVGIDAKDPAAVARAVWDYPVAGVFAQHRLKGVDDKTSDDLLITKAQQATIDGLVKLVAAQNGLTLDDVRRVVSEEVAKGLDVDVKVQTRSAV